MFNIHGRRMMERSEPFVFVCVTDLDGIKWLFRDIPKEDLKMVIDTTKAEHEHEYHFTYNRPNGCIEHLYFKVEEMVP